MKTTVNRRAGHTKRYSY